jgi:hypothetical protein
MSYNFFDILKKVDKKIQKKKKRDKVSVGNEVGKVNVPNFLTSVGKNLGTDIDMDGVKNKNDCQIFNPFKQDDEKEWIQKAVDEENRVRDYIRRVYGNKAFKNNGNLKMSYIDKAINRVKHGEGRNVDNLLKALQLAKRLKKMNR